MYTSKKGPDYLTLQGGMQGLAVRMAAAAWGSLAARVACVGWMSQLTCDALQTASRPLAFVSSLTRTAIQTTLVRSK